MIIIDDRLCLDVLAGRRERLGAEAGEVVATTWGFHYRLVRALTDEQRVGSLSGAAPQALLDRAGAPPPSDLVVLDPRVVTVAAAAAAVRHGLNLLAAELVAAARSNDARVALSETNVGKTWPAAFAAEGIRLQVIAPSR